MENREVEVDTWAENHDALPAPLDGGEINVGKSTKPPQSPTIGFAALKRKMEEAGVRMDDLASKRPRKSRVPGLPKASLAHIRPVQPEQQGTPVGPLDVSVELPMADATNTGGTDIDEPVIPAAPALSVADATGMDETTVEEPLVSASPAPPMADPMSTDETYVEEPSFSIPTAPLMAEAIFDETYAEEPPLSVSPAPTAVERRTSTTPVVSNPRPVRARPKKPVPPGPQIKRRTGKPKKDTSGRVMILRNGFERVITPRDVRLLNNSAGSNARSSLPGYQNFKDSTDDCFFDLLTSVEAALLDNGTAPKDSPDPKGASQPPSTATQVESSQNVESQAGANGTQDIGTPASVITVFKLLLPSLYRRSARNIPEIYEVSQTFWARKDVGSTVAGDSEASSTSTEPPPEPTFFYWDPMPLTSDPLLCPSSLCKKALDRFGHAPAPRPAFVRPDDLEAAFWIIGARYQCADCAEQVKGKGKQKVHSGYLAWDERIMTQLPTSFRKEFPATEVEKRFIVAEHHRSLRRWAGLRLEKNEELVSLSRNWLDPTTNGSIPEPDDASQIPSSNKLPPSRGKARSASLTPSLSTVSSECAKPKAKRKCSKCLETLTTFSSTSTVCAIRDEDDSNGRPTSITIVKNALLILEEIVGSDGPPNTATLNDRVAACGVNSHAAASRGNSGPFETSPSLSALPFGLGSPFRPAPVANRIPPQTLSTSPITSYQSRKRKHVEVVNELGSVRSAGQKRNRLHDASDPLSNNLDTVSLDDETAIRTPTSTPQFAFPDLEPLGLFTPANVASTIQRALDALGQPYSSKQSLYDSPVGLGCRSPSTESTDHSDLDGSPLAIDTPTLSPEPTPPPSPRKDSLECLVENEFLAPSLPTQSQLTQARMPETGRTVADYPRSRSARSIPPGVLDAFKAHLPLLEEISERGIPQLYEAWGSFWVPRKSNLFIQMGTSTPSERGVTTSEGEGLTDTTHSACNPAFFFWHPMAIAVGGVRCPAPGCSKPLSRGSILEEPRSVVVTPTSVSNSKAVYDDLFWIIGVSYRCTQCATGCGLSYESWDPRLLASLPTLLQAEFPAAELDGQFVALPNFWNFIPKVPAEHRLESRSPPSSPQIQDPNIETSTSSDPPPAPLVSLGDNSANSLEESQLPRKDGTSTTLGSISLTRAPSSCSTLSPSLTLHEQDEDISPELPATPWSPPNPGSPGLPPASTTGAPTSTLENTSHTGPEELVSLDRAPSSVQNDLSAQAICSPAGTETQKPPHEASHSADGHPPDPPPSQTRLGRGNTASNGGSRRRSRPITVYTNNLPLIPVPPLTAPKLSSIPTTTPQATFTYPIAAYQELRPLSATDGSSTFTTTETASQGDAARLYKPRRCSKCGVKGCNGGRRIKLCTKPCVGCGQADCDKPHSSRHNLCVVHVPGPRKSKGKGRRKSERDVMPVKGSRKGRRSLSNDSNLAGDGAEVEAQLGVDVDGVEGLEDFDGMAFEDA
ncbi:hypothetical protein FRC01_001720 [Tulasnella sp. 417]|nr:hypothetical protein FRC01_001720 [Tulasnella sp. 417]